MTARISLGERYASERDVADGVEAIERRLSVAVRHQRYMNDSRIAIFQR
jgi:hypothetical protein